VTAAVARGSGVDTGVADPISGVWGDFAGYYLVAALGTAGAWCAVFALFSVLAAVTLRWNPLRSMLDFGGPDGPKQITAGELGALLEGIDWERAKRRKRYLPRNQQDA